MKRSRQRLAGKSALELLEESVHLLRLAPARLLATYYFGTLPFVLGLLYFWADMSRGATAWRHCPQAAVGVALLYIWMKCWQAVFARQIYDRLRRHESSRWTWKRLAQLVTTQALIQSTSFFVLPLAAMIALPFGWAYCFYHNASLLGDGTTAEIRSVVRKSYAQAALWPGQNHVLFSILWLFGFYVFCNIVTSIILLPTLLKTLLGIESAFTMSLWAIFNTTYFAAACCLTYLCMNPLIKTAYVLRCFYGESLQSGADLKAELKPILAVAAIIFLLFAPLSVRASDEPAPANSELATQLDRAINDVINQPEYAWRLPREKPPVTEVKKGLIARFFDAIIEIIRNWLKALRRLLRKIGDWIDRWLRRWWSEQPNAERTRGDWMRTIHGLLFALMAAVACALGILFLRIWKQRQRRRVEAVAEPTVPALDLADENTLANLLPTDEWLAKARELMARGELRLALRALYLASLAHLAQQELIVIAKFKSNRDYERELRRRSLARSELLAAFEQNVRMFESAWYGMHDVTQTILERFTVNFEAIRGRGES